MGSRETAHFLMLCEKPEYLKIKDKRQNIRQKKQEPDNRLLFRLYQVESIRIRHVMRLFMALTANNMIGKAQH